MVRACLPLAEVSMQIKKRMVYWLVLALAITACFYAWFGAKEPPPTERSFPTSQLLIPSLPDWGIYDGPEDWPAHDFYLARAVGGSVVRFMKPPEGIEQWSPDDVNNGLWEQVADMTQWVVKFETVGDARRAYREHYWVPGDTRNPFRTSPWQPLDGLEYESQIADQFRIVCDTRMITIHIGCFLEAQYDEFYVKINYGTRSSDAIGDLKAIATAVDTQMEKFLGSQK